MIQLHGDETINDIKIIKDMIKKPIKALPVNTYKDIKDCKKLKMFVISVVQKLVGKSGGTGISFDWNLLKNLKLKKKWMLAGGLSISNVENTLSITNAPVIDISSGVETEKGIKCKKKIKNLINYLKNEISKKINFYKFLINLEIWKVWWKICC